MRSKYGKAAALLTALAITATACSGDDDSSDETSPTTAADSGTADGTATTTAGDEAPALDGEGLTLGFIQPAPGLFDLLGSAQAGGLALAAQDIADGGGVLGGELEIVADQPSPDQGVASVFDAMVSDGQHLIVGPSSSSEAREIIPMLSESDAVVCGASTTAPGLTTLPGADGRFVRTSFDDDIVTIHTFDRVRERTADVLGRAAKVTIVARGDAYGDGVTSSLSSMLGLVGDEVVVVRYNPEDVLLTGVGDQVAASTPDLVVMISLEEGPRLAGLIQQAGVDPNNMLGLDGLATPRFGEKGNPQDPASLDGATVIGATGPISFLTRLVAQEASQGEVLYGAQAYDCAISFALAVEATGSTDPATVSAALRDVTGGGTICTTYADCRELLQAGEDIDYDGPSGPIEFQDDGEPGGGRFITARAVGGLLSIVADLRIDLEELRNRVAPRVASFIGDIQIALTDLGYYDGPIDGQMNDQFRAAIAAFQTDNGLEPTGELDPATIAAIQDALGDNTILTATILEVQQLLTDLGFYTGPIDGVFSQELSDAIKAFQTSLGVEPTGILDAATLKAIYEAGVTAGQDSATTTTTTTVPTSTTTTPPSTAPATTTTTVAGTTTTTVPTSAVDVLTADGRFTQFLALLTPAVLQAIPQLDDPSAAITLFAPSDDTLTGINFDPTGLSQQEVIELVQYHVIDQAISDAALATGDYPTLLDQGSGPVTVSVDTTPPPTLNGMVFVTPSMPTTAGFVYEFQGLLTVP